MPLTRQRPEALRYRCATDSENRDPRPVKWSTGLKCNREFEPDAWLAFDEHLRLRARWPARPSCTRFEPQGAVDPRGIAQHRHADPPAGALSAVNRMGSVSHRLQKWPVFALTGRVSFAFATSAFDPHRMSLELCKSKHHRHLTPFPKQRVVMTGGAYGEPDEKPRTRRGQPVNGKPRPARVGAFVVSTPNQRLGATPAASRPRSRFAPLSPYRVLSC